MSDSINKKNASFWDEPCGSLQAKSLGVTDLSLTSLKRYDTWYMDFYPYLSRHIPFAEMRGKDVLEIGLGYGTVSQKIAEVGARYVGVDIAQGPVDMVNHRLSSNGFDGQAVVGNILAPAFSPNSFDMIVAIGCLHHTGNLPLAIENCRQMLRQGGRLVFMVYNAFSYRRWRSAPLQTAVLMLREVLGRYSAISGNPKDRAAYDTNSSGSEAPHTDFTSPSALRYLLSGIRTFSYNLENIDREIPFFFSNRERLLKTSFPRVMGLIFTLQPTNDF